MPLLTRLVQGKKNPNRVNLYLDGIFAFALSLDEVAKQGLKQGLELTIAKIDQLKQIDEDEYIFAKILNFLSYRPRTIKEVRDRLWKYAVKDQFTQNKFIDRLISHGYLDDLAFARWFIESRNLHRPRSIRMLKQELKTKGVPEEIISSVVASISDETETITKLLSKKFGLPRRLNQVERQKIYAYLSRQGFPWEKIREVVKNWESE